MRRHICGDQNEGEEARGDVNRLISSALTTLYVYNAMSQLVAEYPSASAETRGGTSYIMQDALGSARVVSLTFVFRIMPKEAASDDLTTMFMPPYEVEIRHRPFEPVIDSDPPGETRPMR